MTSKLAEHLRALPDGGLGALLQLRPDLVVPVPADFSALAARAQGRVSVTRVLDGLDLFTLEILDGLRLVRTEAGTASVDTLLALTAGAGAEPGQVRAAVDRLRARFLVFGPEQELQLVGVIDEACSPYPAGLGRPAAELGPQIATLCADPARLRRTLLSAPPEARAVLDRLAVGPPVGSVASGALRATGTGVDTPGPESAVRWLVHSHLLAATAEDLVELPREVGLVLRRDAGPLGPLHPGPPALDAPARDVKAVDSAGAGQALEAVRHLDALLAQLADAPTPVLRAGGLGVRDLRRLARVTGIDESVAALLLEIAFAAGLLGQSEPSGANADQRWLPTVGYDTWCGAGLAERWARLARAWLTTTRAASVVGQRDDKDRPIGALSPEVTRLTAPATRRAVLEILADLADGTAPRADEVTARLAWRQPRRMGRPDAPTSRYGLATAALAEAASLGITGLGALTGYGRLLLTDVTAPDDDPLGLRTNPDEPADRLVAALDALLPTPVDHFLVQADLTVVVPGPPDPALAAELSLVAQTESRGGATIFRVSPDSVRRALDAGYTAADLHHMLTRRSRTPLPQTLTYLVDDVARRHGGLRVGTAGAYLRSEEESLLAEVFADRRLAPLALRRLAPTVLVTPYPTGRLLAALREAGYAPVPEDAAGSAVLTRPKALRSPARTPRLPHPDDFEPPRLTGPRLAAAVEQIRLGDRLARAARRSPVAHRRLRMDSEPVDPVQAHTHAMAVLQQALREQMRVWVGYVDAHGGTSAKLVRPVSMGAGFLRAEDDRTEMVHTFALHRITSAVPEKEE